VNTAAPTWQSQIDKLVKGHSVSVSVGLGGKWMYRHLAYVQRTPASNEKLLLTMALLDKLDPATTIPTRAGVKAAPVNGVIGGDVWILGNGDPSGRRAEMAALARAIVAAGVTRVKGSIMGSQGPFARDDFATGWHADAGMPIPTALTYNENLDSRYRIISDPERRAALALTKALKKMGVQVKGAPGMGHAPAKLIRVAEIASAPLHAILARMDHPSDNFYAEVLGKYLGQLVEGAPGNISKGAAAMRAFATAHGVSVTPFDASGLSYANRISTGRMVRLLWYAATQPWLPTLLNALPHGGQGTLHGRLTWIRVHAKTGTLTSISALSGFVWLKKAGTWAEFSILSKGMSKDAAVKIENAIVRTVSNAANAPP
jgi:D-alanyl-D-alanine carboxypeptidase/D-alanyl-D-alanine-endopeptidase (penicillin-binding protein 4)